VSQALILAGGFGKRLGKIYPDIPKPMVPFLGKPLLYHQMMLCKKYNFTNIKILLYHQAKVIQEYFGDGSKLGLQLDYCIEKEPLGTAGAILNIFEKLDENFLVLYGDTYLNIDLDSFFKAHTRQDADATLFIHPNNHPHDSDIVEVDDNNYIKEFHSYPHDSNFWYGNLVNGALYAIKKESLFSQIQNVSKQDIFKDLFPILLKNNKKFYGYRSSEYIKDMGTPERIQNVEKDIASKKHIRLQNNRKKIAVFIDRDGVINEERGLITKPDQFYLIDGVSEAIKKINDAGIITVLVTNQPIISRGDASRSELKIIHNKMETILGREGAYLDAIYYCPHHPDNGFEGEISELKIECNCRKPNPGMLLKATEELNIDLDKSWMIGDTTTDIMTAKNIKIRSILVQSGYGGNDNKYDVVPDYNFKNLNQAADFILQSIA